MMNLLSSRLAARLFLLAGTLSLLLVLACMPSFPLLPSVSSSFVGFGTRQIASEGDAGAYLSALAAAQEGDYGNAADFLRQAGAKPGSSTELVERLFTYTLAAGRFREGLILAPHLSQGAPFLQGQALLGLSELHHRDPEAALRRWRRLVLQNEIPSLAVAAAWAEEASSKNPPVYDNWLSTPSSRELPQFAQTRLFHRALIADLRGDPSAENFYRQALQSTGRPSPRTTLAYGIFLERAGRQQDASALYRSLAQGAWGYESGAARAALARMEMDGDAPARFVASPLGGLAEFLTHLALLSLFAQDEETAILTLQLALYANPDTAVARLYLSDILASKGRQDAGIKLLSRVRPQSLYYVPAQIQMAVLYERENAQIERAQNRLEKLAKTLPDNPAPLAALGDFHRRQKDWEAAIDSYSHAIALTDEEDWNLLYMRGIAYERAGRWPEAEEDLRAAMELSDRDPLVMNYLAYSWVEQKRYLPQALKLLEEAVRKQPDSGFIIDSLGWAHYRMGDYGRALFYLEHAAELSPDEAVINDHLGDALWRNGRRIEARFQWQRALDAGPEEESRIVALKQKLLSGLAPPAAGEEGVGVEIES